MRSWGIALDPLGTAPGTEGESGRASLAIWSHLLRETPTSRAPPSSTAAGLERRRGPVASGFVRKRLGASLINICEGDMSQKKYKHVFTMRLPFVCDASVQSMSISASRTRHGSLSYPLVLLQVAYLAFSHPVAHLGTRRMKLLADIWARGLHNAAAMCLRHDRPSLQLTEMRRRSQEDL